MTEVSENALGAAKSMDLLAEIAELAIEDGKTLEEFAQGLRADAARYRAEAG